MIIVLNFIVLVYDKLEHIHMAETGDCMKNIEKK